MLGLQTHPRRRACSLSMADGTDLAGWLIERGYAVAWNGRGTKPVVPWPPLTAREVP